MPEPTSKQGGDKGLRAARALIGWMSPEEAQLLLTGRQAEGRMDDRLRKRFEAARQAVLDRKEGIDQRAVVKPLDDRLAGYLERFWETEHAQPFRQEGWQARTVDLTRLCAFQPSVFIDHAERRTSGALSGDPAALAQIALPLQSDAQPTIQFDHLQKAWVISSDNPNLDVIGHFTRPIKGGRGCGFLVALPPSCMQVVRWQGRYMLKDGYHRALGFLRQGIHRVPALFLDLPAGSDLDLGAGTLTGDVLLGSRPPMLKDYLLDSVSAEIALPGARRMVLIQALTLNPLF